MTTRRTGAIVAASLALGILVGAAGAVVVRDATTDPTDPMTAMADQMGRMESMMGMMGGSMMGGSMMDMMGGAGMGPGSMPDVDGSPRPRMSPGPRIVPGSQHDLHHPDSSQEADR